MSDDMKVLVVEPPVTKFRGPRPPVRAVVGDDVVRIESVSGDPSGSIIMPRDVYDRLADGEPPSEAPTRTYLDTGPKPTMVADPKKRAAAKRARAARRRNR